MRQCIKRYTEYNILHLLRVLSPRCAESHLVQIYKAFPQYAWAEAYKAQSPLCMSSLHVTRVKGNSLRLGIRPCMFIFLFFSV